MPRALVSDRIAPEGVEMLRGGADVDVRTGLDKGDLLEAIPEYEVLVVRSQTRVTEDVLEAGSRLQVVGRAGVGVDNIDLEAATRRGVAVVNAPTGNIIAAAEHTIAMMLASARNVPQAHASLVRGQWRRNEFVGVEVRNKTLGLVGVGRVGSEVAKRARGLEMRVMAYDPYVAEAHARPLGVELAELDQMLAEADFVSLHAPLTDATRGIIGKDQLAQMKPTARLVNVGRGELLDEPALVEALEHGRLGGAALDVFSQEPLTESPLFHQERAIVTPHLGASTHEAQEEVAKEVAEQILLLLDGKPARHVVNAPFLPPEAHEAIAPFLDVASRVGRVAGQLCDGRVESVVVRYEGDLATQETALLRAAALMGVLGFTTEQRVNAVNANFIAAERGLKVVEQKGGPAEEQGSLLTVELVTRNSRTVVSGTALRGSTHVVRINGYWMDVALTGPYLLISEHQDRPGMIGAVGSITGKHDINISFMDVGRMEPRGSAVMVVGLDDPLPPAVLAEIRSVPGVKTTRVVEV